MRKKRQKKQRQFWYDFRDYGHLALWFFRTFEKAMDGIMDFAKDIGRGMPTLILFFIPVITALVFMISLTITAAIIYSAVMLIVLIVVAVAIPLMDLIHLFPIAFYRIWEYIRRWKDENVYVCPYCHEDMWKTNLKLPLHGCPNPKCPENHPLVWPNTYGIFYHKCGGLDGKCDAKIPAMDWLGRAQLDRYCSSCGRLITISQFGFLPQLGFGIMGGPSAGKTSLMIAAIEELQANAPGLGLEINQADEMKAREFEGLQRTFHSGTLGSTIRVNPEAFVWNLATKKKKKGDSSLMYLYDPAGEAYLSQESEGRHRFLRQIAGLIFIIDAFSLTEQDNKPVHASNDSPETVLGTVIRVMEREQNAVGQQFDIPLAVVVSKIDEGEMEQVFGYSSLGRIGAAEGMTKSDQHNFLVRAQLEKLNGNLIRQIEQRFTRVRYFSCAASASNKIRVIEPFLWLLTCCEKWSENKE